MPDYPTRELIIRETDFPDATRQEVVGELVRCKDCKWYDVNRHQCDIQPCAKFYEFDFCSRAERKDNVEQSD